MSKNILQHEGIVLSIVQEYLNKNRYFTIDDVVPFINVRIKKTININYTGIREILKSLIKKKMILERSKLVKDQILDNENRNKIYSYIKDNPGIYFNQIAKNLYLSNYILAWHLKILSQFDFIRSKYIEKHEAFFDTNRNPDDYEILFLVSREKSKKIIDFLLHYQEGSSKTQLSKELKMHSSTVSNYVGKLEQAGVLLKKNLSKKTIYFVNERYYYGLFGP